VFEPESILIIISCSLKRIEKRGDGLQVIYTHTSLGNITARLHWCKWPLNALGKVERRPFKGLSLYRLACASRNPSG
jgi:hypothetical protein